MKTIRKPQDPISLQEEIKKMEENSRREFNIIALYLEKRKPDLRTYGQLQSAIKRHLRPARLLIEFWDDQLLKGFQEAQKQTDGWTLETVVKMLTK